MEECAIVSTPMITGCKRKDDKSPMVDATLYKSMFGGLLYLIASWPNIM